MRAFVTLYPEMRKLRSLTNVVLGLLASPAIVSGQDSRTSKSDTVGKASAAPPAAVSAQVEAIAKHPELGKAGSDFHREFIARFRRYRTEQPAFFADANWPMKLADEVTNSGIPSVAPARPMVPASDGQNQPGTTPPKVPEPAPDPALQVLAFCRENYGKKVGDGQCTSLVVQALKSAGQAGISKDAPGAGDYVWGQLVAFVAGQRKGAKGVESLVQVRAGDVVQFRDARLEGASHDGGGGHYSVTAPHHSAVVADVDFGKGLLVVFEQNATRTKEVVRSTLYLSDLTKGWLKIYRPQRARP